MILQLRKNTEQLVSKIESFLPVVVEIERLYSGKQQQRLQEAGGCKLGVLVPLELVVAGSCSENDTCYCQKICVLLGLSKISAV